uniref:PITH domain-containing protein n=1 Tax=Romanomermis culicivorax TaxID=13658 RepID=A0A915K7S5_ROMCU
MPGNHQHNHGGGCCHAESLNDNSEDERGVLYSLYKKINVENVTCLNERVCNSGKSVFKAYENRLDRDKFVESDTDAELLFNIPFAGNVTIKKIIVIGGENETHPKSMRLFVNKPQ